MEKESLVLSRLECSMMRGLAIILIVANNFGHHVQRVHPDNEFVFCYESVAGFLESLNHIDSIFPLDLLSFYSPFGVMLFIFLSGYGLTLKYEFGSGTNTSSWSFLKNHYLKLFVMQAKGVAIFLCLFLLLFPDEIVYSGPLVRQLLMVANLFPNSPITPGPYWFFGMIMEVYIVYRLLFYQRSSILMMIVVLCSLIMMAVVEPAGDIQRYLRMNLCMALLPFCLGVLVARHWRTCTMLGSSKNCLILLGISLVLLTTCKFYFYSWLLLPVFVVAVSIAVVKLLLRYSNISSVFNWLGGLSGVLFVVHPTVRQLLLDRANESGHPYAVVFLYLFMTIVLSMILKPVFSQK